MIRTLYLLTFLLLSTTSFAQVKTNPSDPVGAIPGEYIIKTKEVVLQSLSSKGITFQQLIKSRLPLDIQTIRTYQNFKNYHHIKLTKKFSLEEVTKMFTDALGVDLIDYIEPDFYVHTMEDKTSQEAPIWNKTMRPIFESSEPLFDLLYQSQSYGENSLDFNIDPKLWGLENSNGIDIDVLKAWEKTQGDPKIVVAVIDTGVNYNHPDLKENIWINPGEIEGNGKDDDRNGFIDDMIGWDFANRDALPYDDAGHGTHVAGTIAAAGNVVKGVAPNVKIMVLKFLAASGNGRTSDAISCIDYAISQGAKIINNSWGGSGYSQALFDIIKKSEEKGTLFVVAAGNETANNDVSSSYPANYQVANLVSIAAIDRYGKLGTFSNYGKKSVHFAAPGVSIYSTYPVDSYSTLSGTSMASPHVAGVAALIWSYWPQLTYDQVISLMKRTLTPMASLSSTTAWGGMVNVGRALQIEDPINVPNPQPDPVTPPTPVFSMDKIGLYMDKKTSGSRRFISLYHKEKEEGQFELIKEVHYSLVGSSIPTTKKTNEENGYLFEFYTSRSSYNLNIKVVTKKGESFYKSYSINTK